MKKFIFLIGLLLWINLAGTGPVHYPFWIGEVFEDRVQPEAKAKTKVKKYIKGDLKRFAIREAKRQGVDSKIILSMIYHESRFTARCTSIKGAKGIMQLMPDTAKDMGVTDIMCPYQNIRGGIKYYKAMLRMFKTDRLALAAYNAGPGTVIKYKGIPPYEETQSYINNILK